MEAGDRIDGWVVDRRLGTGGMGSVYRCRNASTDRILAAVKVLESSLRDNEEAQARFAREAHILARLDHPGVVRVRNVRIDADPPYLEMEFIEGESLEEQIRRGPLPYPEALEFLRQVAEAVRYLHASGVRHRDLKPANLIVDLSGRVRIVDFGLATETELARITADGLNFGTVAYAPPEWIDPQRLDPVQWDLYALGVLFHELLTGQTAFPMSGQGPVRKQLLQVMMHKQSAPPLDPGDGFPEEARALVRALTANEAASRPQTADEVVARFAALPNLLSDARPALFVPARPPPRRRFWWLAATPVLGVMLVAVAVCAFALRPSPQVAVEPPSVPVPALPPTRAVTVAVQVPVPVPVRVRAGDVEAQLVEGRATLEGVAVDVTEVAWVAGAECEPCPGASCPAWCGQGVAPLSPGEDPAEITLSIVPGKGPVSATLPLLAAAIEGGPFRKKKPIWHVSATLDGTPGTMPNHWSVRWDPVVAGKHELVATIGGCAPEARGCWPDRTCPPHCRSALVEVIVPWGGGPVAEKIRMPPPP